MRVIARASIKEIESHLQALGAGNQADNMTSISAFKFFFLVSLSETEFFQLVFLQSPEVAEIAPQKQDRCLGAVALRARNLGRKKLSDNWDLGLVRDRLTERQLRGQIPRLPPLLLRDARNHEKSHGPWYLQVGTHRALGYALGILENKVAYASQDAYVATNTRFDELNWNTRER